MSELFPKPADGLHAELRALIASSLKSLHEALFEVWEQMARRGPMLGVDQGE